MNEQVKPPGKKIYQEPSLRVYGDIRIMTQAASMMATVFDGGAAPTRKT